ncbi:MAG: hypothetical protein ACRC1K_27175 [Planctomycetia bacterium]
MEWRQDEAVSALQAVVWAMLQSGRAAFLKPTPIDDRLHPRYVSWSHGNSWNRTPACSTTVFGSRGGVGETLTARYAEWHGDGDYVETFCNDPIPSRVTAVYRPTFYVEEFTVDRAKFTSLFTDLCNIPMPSLLTMDDFCMDGGGCVGFDIASFGHPQTRLSVEIPWHTSSGWEAVLRANDRLGTFLSTARAEREGGVEPKTDVDAAADGGLSPRGG